MVVVGDSSFPLYGRPLSKQKLSIEIRVDANDEIGRSAEKNRKGLRSS